MEPTYINDHGPFYEAPCMCGVCKFGVNSRSNSAGGKTWCALFDKSKNYYDSPPKRCQEMFRKALEIGGNVVIVARE